MRTSSSRKACYNSIGGYKSPPQILLGRDRIASSTWRVHDHILSSPLGSIHLGDDRDWCGLVDQVHVGYGHDPCSVLLPDVAVLLVDRIVLGLNPSVLPLTS